MPFRPDDYAGGPSFVNKLYAGEQKRQALMEETGPTSVTAGAAQVGASPLMGRTGAAGELATMRNKDPGVDQGLWKRTQDLARFIKEFPGAMGGPVA